VRLLDRRIGLLFALFLLLLTAITLRAAWLGTVRAGSLKQRAVTQQVEDLKVTAQRGTISDRHGVELAVAEDAVSVFANPFLVKNPVSAAAKLAPILGQPVDDVLSALADRKKGFVYLRRKMDAGVAKKVAKLKLTGIGTVGEPRRIYPQGALAGQLLGTVGTDNFGLSGLEQQYEKELHGSDGHRRLVKDAMGDPVSIVESARATAGKDIRLTIDAALQERVEAVMEQVGRDHSPHAATAVLMDPRNGQILALSNWPRMDPNDAGDVPASTRMDRAVAGSYEPGSTFKAFTVAGALQDGVVRPDDQFHLPTTLHVADRTIEDAEARGPVDLSVAQILAHSSNVGAATIGLKMGKRRFAGWVRRFGFGRPTGVGVPGEAPGIVLSPDRYSGSTLGNMSMGQGLAVTPLQMAAAYSALGNGGVLHRPHVILGQGDPGRRVVSQRTSSQVVGMLEGVLGAGGTAEGVEVPGYQLAGKTGTAEKPDPKTGGYSKFKFFSSFIGFAPARNPRLMVAVMVDEPKGEYYGAEVAAPAFEQILQFALPYMRIPPR
jgi:cell division protein FtsI (penicillin-binding protein 3)